MSVLCFDFGASGGRAMLADFDSEKITLREVHRFKNRSVQVNDTLYWDILSLYSEVKTGLVKACRESDFISIGIDTWGVDYGLIDSNGQLMGNPVQYRDSRTSGLLGKVQNSFGIERLYGLTGIQVMEINTVFQLTAEQRDSFYKLENASAMLNIPDLLAYMLTGEISSEMSISSTTQLFSPKTLDWIDKIQNLGFPENIFRKIVKAGESKGFLLESICTELDIPSKEVVAVCGHDTQCASFAVPAEEKDFIFLSSGTWSLLGTVLDKPVISKKAYELGLSNEVGYGGKINLLKNITGLWLVQETKAFLESRGQNYTFAELETLARNSEFTAYIDTDSEVFSKAGNIPERIRFYCRETGQPVPKSTGDVMRVIYLSLAMKYRYACEQISSITNKNYNKIYMVGGGTKDSLLCQITADVCGMEVSAGPVEATAIGNASVQLIKCGKISSPEDLPRIIRKSDTVKIYTPMENYDREYEEYKKILLLKGVF